MKRTIGLYWLVSIALFFAYFFSFYSIDVLGQNLALDFYQIMADSLRLGSLEMIFPKGQITHFDLAAVGEKAYLTWGIVPALIYVPFDIVSEFITGSSFPKVILWAIVCIIHLYLVGRIIWFKTECRAVGLIGLILYAITNPFSNFITHNVEVYELCSIYGITFLLFSYLSYLKSGIHGKSILWSAIALGLALSTKQTLALYFPFLILILFSRKDYRNTLSASAVFGAFLALWGAYNYARFGSPFVTGYGMIYEGGWVATIDQVLDLDYPAMTYLTSLVRKLGCFTTMNVPSFPSSEHTVYQWICGDGHNPFISWLNILWIGAGYGAWKYRTKITQWCPFALGAFALLGYYFFIYLGFELRYMLDFFPILYITMFVATLDVMRSVSKQRKLVLVLLSLMTISVYLFINLSLGPWRDLLRTQDKKFDTYTTADKNYLWYTVSDELTCESVKPIYKSEADLQVLERAILDQDNIYRFNIFALPNYCIAKNFMGATLSLNKGSSCTVAFSFDSDAAPDCEKSELYLETSYMGKMSFDKSNGQTTCRYNFNHPGHKAARFFLYEYNGEWPISLDRTTYPNWKFRKMFVHCR